MSYASRLSIFGVALLISASAYPQQQGTDTPKRPRASPVAAAKAASTPSPALTTIKGPLVRVLVSGGDLFGPGTSYDTATGELVSRSESKLAIEHKGKALIIETTPQTKSVSFIKDGMLDTEGPYRITGHVREGKIFATEITRE